MERWRHRPLRVVEPVEGTCIGGVVSELRRRFLPRSSEASDRGGCMGCAGDESIEAMVGMVVVMPRERRVTQAEMGASVPRAFV